MISALFLALAQSPSATGPSTSGPSVIGPDDVTGRVLGTSIAFKLHLPEFKFDGDGLNALRKKYGEMAIWRGARQPGDTTVNLIAVRGKNHTSAEWRDIILSDKKVGAGLFDIDGTACSEQIRELEAPYQSVGWHGFLTVHEACVDVHVFTTAKGDELAFTKDDFAAVVKSARFALARRGTWDELPERFLDLSHRALLEANGPAWLREQVRASPKDEKVAGLVLAEHMLDAKAEPDELVKTYSLALAALAAAESSSKQLVFARALALDGLGVAELRASHASDAIVGPGAIPHLIESRDLAAKSAGVIARAGIAYDLATAYASVKDVANTVASLKSALDLDPIWIGFAQRDEAFDPVRAEKAFADLVPAPPKTRPR